VDLRDRSIYAYEALARGPAGESATWVFSNARERDLDVLDHSLRVTAMQTARRLCMKARLSVNLFPQARGGPSASIRNTLNDADREDFPCDQLIFEITESARVTQPARLRDFVAMYRDFGFKTAIDDFGAGYSGLQLLSEFRPDIIKLDMQFTRHAPHDHRGRTLIRNIVATAAELGCDIIAEGVETSDESDVLRDLGIYRQQGYLFSAPVVDSLPEVHWPLPADAQERLSQARWEVSV
jgi:EAL domain-containing protein (putative c-di-GMP-specific phosphodiesterase class I)